VIGGRRRRGAAAALVLASLSLARPATANGRYPIAGQIALSPTNHDLLALRTTFGLLVSRDGGQAWDWICEPAVGYSDVTQDPTLGLTANAAIVGMFEGLAVSQDQGCSWSTQVPAPVSDLVVRRDNTHAALALVSSYQGRDDGGNFDYGNVVYQTRDDGAHWTLYGVAIDPLLIPETIDVSSDGGTVYVSGYSFGPNGSRIGVFARSTDGGAHYVESTLDLGPSEAAPFIGAVDPRNPMRVYVRVAALPPDTASSGTATTGDRLLVTDDGGQSFRTVLTSAGPLLGFAISPDGAKVYAGGPVDGLEMATSASLSFVKRSSLPVQCLASTGTALLACSDDAVAFLLGTSKDDGASFSPVLHRSCVRGALACPASSSAAQCAALFGGLASSQIGTGGPGCGDAGASVTADGSPGHVTGPSRGSGCSCRAAPGGRSGLDAGAVAGLMALLCRRARR
jgi:hypothetical protein